MTYLRCLVAAAILSVIIASAQAQAETPVEHGARKVLVLLVRWSGSAEIPWSKEIVREKVFTDAKSANEFYQEESYGQISLTGKLQPDGDVFGWYTIPGTAESACEPRDWVDDANQIAEEQGVNLSGYDDIIYDMSNEHACGWGGYTTSYGIFVRGTNTGTFAHELGHGLGLWHAKSLKCPPEGSRINLTGTCTIDTYGDPFDVMGRGGLSRTSNWNLMSLGVLKPENLQRVTEAGEYTIDASFFPTSATTDLEVPHTIVNGEVRDWFDFEVRYQGGVFAGSTDASKTGVTVRLVADHRDGEGFEEIRINSSLTSSFGTLLIDAHPETSTFDDAPIRVGQTVVLESGSEAALVKVLSVESGHATVKVAFDHGPPTSPSGLTAQQVGQQVNLDWTASSDDSGVARYVVLRDGAQVGTTTSPHYVDQGPGLGAHTYSVYAEDALGNQSPVATKTVSVADHTSPTAPGWLKAKQQGKEVLLEWAASGDYVGSVVRYVVLRDGASAGIAVNRTFHDPAPAVGPHVYTVYAEDDSGNKGGSAPESRISVADVSAPTAPGRLVASQVGEDVRLEWGGSSDDIGVSRYVVVRDGTQIGSSSGFSYLDPRPTSGNHVYRIHAEDAAGNRGSASPDARINVVHAATSADAPAGQDGAGDVHRRATGGGWPKPELRWISRRNGLILFEVRVPTGMANRTKRIELLLDGRRLGAARGAVLTVRWRPATAKLCVGKHELRAKAYFSGGGLSTTVRTIRLGRPGQRPTRC